MSLPATVTKKRIIYISIILLCMFANKLVVGELL